MKEDNEYAMSNSVMKEDNENAMSSQSEWNG